MIRDSKAFRIIVWIALGIIPMIYAGLLVWSNADPTDQLADIPAAIVDEDAGATVTDADGAETQVNLGGQLTDNLTTADEPAFDWRVLDAATAAAQLDAGDVYAVLTIPAGFSADATSSAATDPAAAATSGKLEIRTDDAHNFLIGTVSKTVATVVADALSEEVRKDYLEGVYNSFGALATQLGDAADGASQVADGAGDLQDGTMRLASGADDLSSGIGRLKTGADTLSSGVTQLASGARDLQDGTTQLASGAADLSSGVTQLGTGAATLSGGLTQLAAGAGDLRDASTQLATGAAALGDGTASVADGATNASVAATSLETGLQSLDASWSALPEAQRKAILDQLVTGAQQLVGTAPSATSAGSGLSLLAAGAAQTASGASTLASGASQLATGAATLATKAGDAASGASTLATKLGTAVTGASILATKLGAAESGATTLAAKLGEAATGASTLASGLTDAASGAVTLADGAHSAESGASELADGSTTLATGLADGAAKVPAYTDAEAAARAAVAAQPVLLDTVREHDVETYGAGLLPYFLSLGLWVGALATFMMRAPLAEKLLRRRSLGAVLVALRSYWPAALLGLAQAAAAVLVLRLWVGIPMADLAGVFGIAALASLTFMAVNQGLVGLFGPPGRFLALLLVVLQLSAGGGTYPVQTAAPFFQAIHAWLPVTHSMNAIRTLVAGGGQSVLPDVLVILAWLVGGLALAVAGVVVQRRREDRGEPNPDEIEHELEQPGAITA